MHPCLVAVDNHLTPGERRRSSRKPLPSPLDLQDLLHNVSIVCWRSVKKLYQTVSPDAYRLSSCEGNVYPVPPCKRLIECSRTTCRRLGGPQACNSQSQALRAMLRRQSSASAVTCCRKYTCNIAMLQTIAAHHR